jgi:hypothetical protein
MVPVDSPGQLLLVDARATLERDLKDGPHGDFAVLFAYWIGQQPVSRSDVATLVGQLVRRTGAQQDFQTVAALGFALDAGLLDPGGADALRHGLKRLAGRNPFVDGMPMPFCSDAVGVLGIAVGTKALADAAVSNEISAWLAKFLGKIHSMSGTEEWQRCLFHAADSLVEGVAGITPRGAEAASDARAALASKGILLPLNEAEEGTALAFIARNSTEPLSYERALLRSTALNWLIRTVPILAPNRVTVDSLVRLLERVPAGLRNWTWEQAPRTAATPTRRWYIDHEYHVQNLLWMLLSPIFPDLDDEQYLTKIGQKNPRADFYIPSMKLIVEAKFLRPAERIQRIIDEIAADLSLYRSMGNECAGVIPFIWDDGARTNEHDYLRQGLRKMPGLVDAVIVSRPRDWAEPVAPSHSKSPGARKSKR